MRERKKMLLEMYRRERERSTWQASWYTSRKLNHQEVQRDREQREKSSTEERIQDKDSIYISKKESEAGAVAAAEVNQKNEKANGTEPRNQSSGQERLMAFDILLQYIAYLFL